MRQSALCVCMCVCACMCAMCGAADYSRCLCLAVYVVSPAAEGCHSQTRAAQRHRSRNVPEGKHTNRHATSALRPWLGLHRADAAHLRPWCTCAAFEVDTRTCQYVASAYALKLTCNAWMSKITRLVGPPRDGGTLDRMRANVKAVATSPSVSTCIPARTQPAC